MSGDAIDDGTRAVDAAAAAPGAASSQAPSDASPDARVGAPVLGGSVAVEVGGVPALALPQRVLWLPGAGGAGGALLVADAHLGKAASFRRLGVPVPEATTGAVLHTLSALLAATGATQVVFLGDLLHSARGRSAGTLAEVAAWRRFHAGVALTLVRGNHDARAGDPPADWRVTAVDEPWRPPGAGWGRLLLAHHPRPSVQGYVLAGHLHPGVRVGGAAHQRLRLPCFHFGPAVGVLPAFGAFTGLHVLPRGPADRVLAIAGEVVRALPRG